MEENWEDEILKWSEDLEKEQEEEKRKNKFREFGKLGGRPPKNEKKNKKITIRVTEKEKEKLQEKSDKLELSLAEFVRRSALEISLPNAEKNKTLIEYRTNFKRLSNHFRSNIWTPEERNKFTELLKKTIKGIEKELNL